MAIAEKLQNIINEKNDQATITNYGLTSENQINSSTKFIDYPKYILNAFLEALRTPDTLFTNLPKKSGSGANITLNDTANAPMRIELGSRALEQATTTGKNKLYLSGLTTYTSNQVTFTPVYKNGMLEYINVNGTATNDNAVYTIVPEVNRLPISAGTYTISGTPSGGGNDKWKTTIGITGISEYYDSGSGKTITVSSDNTYYYKLIVYQGQTMNNVKWYPMIESGSSVTQYEPYTGGIPAPNPSYPQDIHTISGSNKVVVNTGNLFDEKKYLTETFTTGTYKYALANFKGSRTLYVKAQVKSGKTAISDLFVAFTSNGSNPNSGTSHFVIRYNDVNNGQIDFTGINDIYVSYYPTTYTWQQINEVYDIWVSTNDINYAPYVTSQEADIDIKSANLLQFYEFSANNSKLRTHNGVTAVLNYDGTITLNGTATGNPSFYIKNNGVGLGANKKLVFIAIDGSFTGNTSAYAYNSSYGGTKEAVLSTLGKAEVELGPNIEYTLFELFGRTGNVYNNARFGIMVVDVSKVVDKYIPYYDYGFCGSIGNYEDKFIRTSGKNLLPFNASDLTINQYISSSNGSEQTSTSGNFYGSFEYINFNYGGKTITLSDGLEVAFYDTSKTFISYVGRLLERTQIVPSNCKYIRIDCYKDNINNMQINLGDTLLSYEPYGSNEWYIKKNIGKVVLDGSESWSDFSTGDTNFRCQYDVALPNILTPPSNPAILLCNYFSAANRDNVYAKTQVGIAQYGSTLGKIFFCAPNSILSEQTLNGWKTWLNTHNLIVYYLYATPTYTPITGTLANQLENVYKNMLSQKGQTNISQINEDLSFNLNVLAIEE